jgi:hypothetical protein
MLRGLKEDGKCGRVGRTTAEICRSNKILFRNREGIKTTGRRWEDSIKNNLKRDTVNWINLAQKDLEFVA